jgi:hypothetical protein
MIGSMTLTLLIQNPLKQGAEYNKRLQHVLPTIDRYGGAGNKVRIIIN